MSIPVSNNLASPENYMDLTGLKSIGKGEDSDAAIKKIAKQFESMFVQMMLKNMRSANAVFEEDSLFNSNESDFYRDMHDNQLALTMAHGRGLGIAEALYRQMSRVHGGKSVPITEVPAQSMQASFVAKPDVSELQAQKHIQPQVKTTEHEAAAEPTIKATEVNAKNTADRISIANDEREFIEKTFPYAVEAARKIGVDPKVLVAQSALETGWGRQVLAGDNGQSSHNLFNIKTGSGWDGDKVRIESLEFRANRPMLEASEFRSYADMAESFSDYSDFILRSQRYSKAVENAADPEAFIQQLHEAGYATDPEYTNKVIAVMQRVSKVVDDSATVSPSRS
ncbi:flagellar assembly peptidoglycan hydrolase FlgJ [Teredinibacter sp. KSP-S5-2]|uniref:flagellar assembly peptidoglycan hydrolase FlgJ n=1 Tax=Teredinibacter sp. KSP-S5-2 TaxID=3034506 RepID=UPI00293482F8|nr:flagellar assembly peptidoglycan hydrolase FlgJ [Teredinibacter sp. KSP-S5-2]WNO07965.1 flagellar assembly peptidoglycan hydrolase FlgJ [Teredinibacter sp. KSP-S5-2]